MIGPNLHKHGDCLVDTGPGGPQGDRPNLADRKRPAGVAGSIWMVI